MKKLLLACLFCPGLLFALTPDVAKNFIVGVVDEALTTVNASTKENDSVNKKFGEILTKNFALNAIVKYVLGTNLKKMTPQQVEKFSELYKKRLLQTYADESKVSKFRGATHSIVGTPKKSNEKFIVESSLTTKDGLSSKVEWEVMDEEGNPKISDVKIEGVSKKITERSDYKAIFSQNGGNINETLASLEE
jgi:phospholipid transport system substrate-binding protein